MLGVGKQRSSSGEADLPADCVMLSAGIGNTHWYIYKGLHLLKQVPPSIGSIFEASDPVFRPLLAAFRSFCSLPASISESTHVNS
jgi:hypothetical protein